MKIVRRVKIKRWCTKSAQAPERCSAGLGECNRCTNVNRLFQLFPEMTGGSKSLTLNCTTAFVYPRAVDRQKLKMLLNV